MTTWIWLRAARIGGCAALWLSAAWGLVATTGVGRRSVPGCSSSG